MADNDTTSGGQVPTTATATAPKVDGRTRAARAAKAAAAEPAGAPAVSRTVVENGSIVDTRARNAAGEFVATTATKEEMAAFREMWPEKYEEMYGKRGAAKSEPDHPFVAAANEATSAPDDAAPVKVTATEKENKPETQDASKDEAAAKETAANPARDKAVKALKLDGFTDSQIAKFDEAELIAAGQRATARHSEFEKLRAQAREPKRLTASETVKETAAKAPELDPESQALVKGLEEEIGSEKAGKALERLQLMTKQRIEQLEAAMLEKELQSVRAELRERLPGLAEEDVWSQTLDEVEDLYHTRRWAGKPLAEVMQAAYRNVVPDPTPAEVESDRLQRNGTSAAPAAAPKARTSSEIDPRKLTQEQKIDWIYRQLDSGVEPEEVLRAAGH